MSGGGPAYFSSPPFMMSFLWQKICSTEANFAATSGFVGSAVKKCMAAGTLLEFAGRTPQHWPPEVTINFGRYGTKAY